MVTGVTRFLTRNVAYVGVRPSTRSLYTKHWPKSPGTPPDPEALGKATKQAIAKARSGLLEIGKAKRAFNQVDAEVKKIKRDDDSEDISGIHTTTEDYDSILEDEFLDDDTTTAGYMQIESQRHLLHYLRLIEHEMPKLVAYRKPYTPPTSETPIIVRSITYGGEPHPITAKRVITVAVDELGLKDEDAVHRIKLLAGSRWSPRPHADGGICSSAEWGNGYIKISCENFPTPDLNLKWASDALDRLVKEANTPRADKFKDVPVDIRHIISKARKARRGEHLRGRLLHRPTKHDFPEEWLPQDKVAEDRKLAIV